MEKVKKNILNQREELFEKIRKSGFLWSYSKEISFNDFPENIFIEHTLKYADFPELNKLFNLYDINRLKKIWEERVAHDQSFIRTNVLLAKVFFDLNYDAPYFRTLKNPRYEKLRLLAERD